MAKIGKHHGHSRYSYRMFHSFNSQRYETHIAGKSISARRCKRTSRLKIPIQVANGDYVFSKPNEDHPKEELNRKPTFLGKCHPIVSKKRKKKQIQNMETDSLGSLPQSPNLHPSTLGSCVDMIYMLPGVLVWGMDDYKAPHHTVHSSHQGRSVEIHSSRVFRTFLRRGSQYRLDHVKSSQIRGIGLNYSVEVSVVD